MHTYRRLASTASSTSRSASTSVHHSATHNSTSTTRLSRSSSTTAGAAMAPSSVSSASASSATPLAESYSYGYAPHGINVAIPTGISRSLASPNGSVSSNGRSSSSVSIGSPSQESYTRAELQTIAESLLAHVSFGPYHIACSPVPSSHLRQHFSTSSSTASMRSDATPSSFNNYQLDKENMQGTTSALNPSNLLSSSSGSIYNPVLLGPSARRQFEGKEGHHHPVSNLTLRLSNMSMTPIDSSATSTPTTTHHPRARFTIGGGGEMERGRGMGRKAVPTTRRELSSQHERGYERDSRGRRGGVKELS